MMRFWLQASRLPSQLYICVPLFVGQILATESGFHLDKVNFVLTHLYGLFMQLFIVYSNDYFDLETDKINRKFNLFTGGSRVLVDNQIAPKQLLRAAFYMAFFTCVTTFVLTYRVRDFTPIILGGAGLLLMWAYSFPPARLSYRGGGEFLQMLGVGAVLPSMGYVAQSGHLFGFPVSVLAILLPTQLACALSTTLPDVESDKKSGKKTFAVLIGEKKILVFIVILQLYSWLSLLFHNHLHNEWLTGGGVLWGILVLLAGQAARKEKWLVPFIGVNILVTLLATLSLLGV